MVRPMHPTFGENLIQSDLRNLTGNPLETAALLSNLIFEGTLDRFPGNGDTTIDPRIKFLWRDEGMGFTGVSGRERSARGLARVTQ